MELRKLTELFTEDRAVSPVIGVILMVAITVILAAVIGSFVLGLGSQANASPQASFEFDYDGTTLYINHQGGDTIAEDDLSVISDGSVSKTTDDGEYTAGDEVAEVTSISSDDRTRVVYNDPNSDKSSVLATSTAP